MQSFMDPGPPLSPSSFFNFDGPMEGGSSMMGSEDGVDLFRYYMDLQAFQGKEQQQSELSSMTVHNGDTLTSTNTGSNSSNSMLSPYNAFFNPAAYLNTPSSSSSPSSISPSSINPAASQPTITQQQESTSTTSASLFPFAEATSNSHTQSHPGYNPVNPASLLSFDHLAGSENPQPIDPHLLMGGQTTSSKPPATAVTVKEEDIEQPTTSAFPLSFAFPLSASTTTSNHAQAQAHAHAQRGVSASSSTANNKRGSASTMQQHDDSMNGIDGLSDESDSEDDEDEDDHPAAPRKRSSATTTATSSGNKKRTSAATKTSSSSKRASAQSKKESSILHSQQTHPHALVPVPEWEDRLSKAEYDKLSSKEKRQMRNKISARNFRHRRKAHIDTLEALVADKEDVIAVLSEEVGTLRTENQGLRADIEVLKKNWESIAAKIGASAVASTSNSASQHVAPAPPHHHLTPDEDDLYGAPGSLPALSPAASSSAESTNGDHLSELSFEHARGMAESQAQTQASQARPSTSSSTTTSGSREQRVTRSSIQRPNLRKDLGPSGTSFSAFGMGNRSMNVHTTLIPELNFNFPIPPPSVFSSLENSSPPASTTATLPALTDATSASSGRTSPVPSINGSNTTGSIADMLAGKRERDANANARLNMNPALNGLSQEQINNLREQFFNANSGMISSPPQSSDEISANVSGKIARSSSSNLDPLQNSFFDTNPFISLRQDSLQDYRAQLYAKLANNVAGIHQAQQQQSQPNKHQQQQGMNGLRPAFFANQPIHNNQVQDVEEVAKIASIAQKTLFDKLSTAFWDAFAGNNTPAIKSLVPAKDASAAVRKGRQSSPDNGDGHQVADLLAGRSRLQIVKNERQEDDVDDAKIDSLTQQVENMGLKK